MGGGLQAPDGLLPFSPQGSPRQKGTIMGTLRSLGALARAVGPMVAASGEGPRAAGPGLGATGPGRGGRAAAILGPRGGRDRVGPRHGSGSLSTVYWLAGARVCFTVCSGLFLLPLLLLWNLRPPAHALKAE